MRILPENSAAAAADLLQRNRYSCCCYCESTTTTRDMDNCCCCCSPLRCNCHLHLASLPLSNPVRTPPPYIAADMFAVHPCYLHNRYADLPWRTNIIHVCHCRCSDGDWETENLWSYHTVTRLHGRW